MKKIVFFVFSNALNFGSSNLILLLCVTFFLLLTLMTVPTSCCLIDVQILVIVFLLTFYSFASSLIFPCTGLPFLFNGVNNSCIIFFSVEVA